MARVTEIPAGTITRIRVVVNMTSKDVRFTNKENSNDDMTVSPNSVNVCHPGGTAVNIPWCDSQQRWDDGHVIYVDAADDMDNRVTYAIWQSGPIVRYCTDNKWKANGAAIPGSESTGDMKIIVIDKALGLRCKQLSRDPFSEFRS